MNAFLDSLLSTLLDDTYRGVPPGAATIALRDVAQQQWRPDDGSMALPVLTLDEAAFAHNRDLIFAYARRHNALLAPHAKTPMSPQLLADLMRAGAWGATVANLQQASVMLRTGVPRLMIANEIGGAANGRRLGQLLKTQPQTDVHAWADSQAAVRALAQAAREAGRPLSVMVHVGGGRAGARDEAAVRAVIAAIDAEGALLRASGIATYEGAVAVADPVQCKANIDALLERARQAFEMLRAAHPQRELMITAGGSAFFDAVTAGLAPFVASDGNATLVLRSGAIFFHDHGVYQRAFAAMQVRGGWPAEDGAAGTSFRPALRLWGEVLSRPEPGLAIMGFGMRDVSFDLDLPTPLAAFRHGSRIKGWGEEKAEVTKLNDQHAFLAVSGDSNLAPGDIVEFGISHPCTCLDRWRLFFGLAGDGGVRTAYRTYFG